MLIDAWATYEALRRLGFEASALAVSLGRVANFGGTLCVVVQLADQGKEFTVVSGQWLGTEPEFDAEWDGFWTEMLRAPDAELTALWHVSRASAPPQLLALIGTLLARGLRPPALSEFSEEDLATIAERHEQSDILRGLMPGGTG